MMTTIDKDKRLAMAAPIYAMLLTEAFKVCRASKCRELTDAEGGDLMEEMASCALSAADVLMDMNENEFK